MLTTNTSHTICSNLNTVFSEGHQSPFFLPSDRNRPVVILIHVNKQNSCENARPFLEQNYMRYFNKIYESKGWITLQCTPSDDVTHNGDECGRVVQSVMACLESRGHHQNPIFLHLLGPRSVPVYNEFTKAVKMERDDLFQIRGSIIDSAPSRPEGIGASLRKRLPTIFNIYLALLHILAVVFPEFFRPPDEFDCYEDFCYNRYACPQLFLYSQCDHIVNPLDVETVINIRHGAGVQVDKQCWPDSEHARHLFTHEVEYTELCQNFVEKIIKSS